MPDFTFTGPDNKQYSISGPEGATREQAFQLLPMKYPELKGQPGFEGGEGKSATPTEPGLVGIQEALGLPADSPKTRSPTEVVKDWFKPREKQKTSVGEVAGDVTAQTIGGAGLGLALPGMLEKGGSVLRKVPFGPAKAVGGAAEGLGAVLSLVPPGERAARGAVGGALQASTEQISKVTGLPTAYAVPLSLGAGALGEAGTSFVLNEGGRLLQFAKKLASGGEVVPPRAVNAAAAAKLQKRMFGDKLEGYVDNLKSSENRMAAQIEMRQADPTLVTGMARKPQEVAPQPIPGTGGLMSDSRELATTSMTAYGNPGTPQLALPGPQASGDKSWIQEALQKKRAEVSGKAAAAAEDSLRPASEIYRDRMFSGITQAINEGKLFSTSPAAQEFAKKVDLLVQSRELTQPQAQKLLATLRTDRSANAGVRDRFAANLDNTIRTWGKPAEKGGQEGAAAIPAKLAEEIRADLRMAVNKYAEQVGLGKVESQYRNAYAKEKLAQAKDELPHYLYFSDPSEFAKLARNLSKDPSTKPFLQKTLGQHLASIPAQDVPKEFLRLQKVLVNSDLVDPADLSLMRQQATDIQRVLDKGVQLNAQQRFQRILLQNMGRKVMGAAGQAVGQAAGQQ